MPMSTGDGGCEQQKSKSETQEEDQELEMGGTRAGRRPALLSPGPEESPDPGEKENQLSIDLLFSSSNSHSKSLRELPA